MKRILLPLMLLAALGSQAQEIISSPLTQTPTFLACRGEFTLNVVRAEHNAIEYTLPQDAPKAELMSFGSKVGIRSTGGYPITLYYAGDTLCAFVCDGTRLHLEPGVVMRGAPAAPSAPAPSDSLAGEIRSLGSSVAQEVSALAQNAPKPKRHTYTYAQRTFFQIHWGLNNWGTTPINGLSCALPEAYTLRTTPSSWQLSYHYSFLLTDHLRLAVGAAYESNVGKHNLPWVALTPDGEGLTTEGVPAPGGWESRFVARYIDLPLTLGLRQQNHGFELMLSAVPGLAVGAHLKHINTNGGDSETTRQGLGGAVSPLKLDARAELRWNHLGVFLQMAALPLLAPQAPQELYPIKAGLSLTL